MSWLRTLLAWRVARWVGLVAAVLVLGALLAPLALRGPRLVRVTPAAGEQAANPDEGVLLEFDQPVWPATVAAALSVDPPVPLVWRWEGRVVRVRPRDGLRHGTTYRLRLGDGVRGLLGRALDCSGAPGCAPRSLSFATAPYVGVLRVAPAAGADRVPLDTALTVEFGAPVVAPELVAAALEDGPTAAALPQPLTLSPPVPGRGRWLSPTLFSFAPEGGLQAATTYTATLRADLAGDGRLRLSKPRIWSFSTDAPLLLSTEPPDDASGVSPDSAVMLALAPGVDPRSAAAGFRLREVDNGSLVAGQVEATADGLRFVPAAPLRRGARYQAELGGGVLSSAGVPLNPRPLSWQFTVLPPLMVAASEPANGATEVPTSTARLSLRFSAPMVAEPGAGATGDAPLVTISPALPGAWHWQDRRTYVFVPAAPLAPATTYHLELAGAADLHAGQLDRPYRWSLTTVMPQVVSSAPTGGEMLVELGEPLRVVFSQPLDPASVRRAIRLRELGAGVDTPVRVQVEGATALVRPTAPWRRGANYRLYVSREARLPHGGTQLGGAYEATFRIPGLPALAASEPPPGQSEVDYNTPVRLVFTAPMDWASVERALRVEPRPTSIITETRDTSIALVFPMRAQTEYRLTLGAEARDRYGVALGVTYRLTFHTRAPLPSLQIVGAGSYWTPVGAFGASAPVRVPVRHSALASFRYELRRLEQAPDAALVAALSGDLSGALPAGLPLVQQGERRFDDGGERRLELLDLGRLAPGVYGLAIQGKPARGATGSNGHLVEDRLLLLVSPYALTLKQGIGELFVWAVDLASGRPVADLALMASRCPAHPTGPCELGRTDREGVLRAPWQGEPWPPVLVWSPDTARFAAVASPWNDGIDPWSFGLAVDYTGEDLLGNIATDRPVYRPAQTVYIRGALRGDQGEGYVIPSGTLRLSVSDPNGRRIAGSDVTLSAFGTFSSTLLLERGATLGSYTVAVGPAGGRGRSPAVVGHFSVAEYRAPSFELVVAPEQPDLTVGEPLVMRVAARYFASGPLADAPVRWRLLAEPLVFAPARAADFCFTDPRDAYAWYRGEDDAGADGRLVADGQATTDAQGQLTLRLPAPPAGWPVGGEQGGPAGARPTRLTLDVEVSDIDGQVVAARGVTSLHPAGFYIGLRTHGYVGAVGTPRQVELLTLDPAGRPAPERDLELRVYHEEWYSIRARGGDGRLSWESRLGQTLVMTATRRSDGDGRATLEFTPPRGGTYRVEAAGHDAEGRAVGASIYSWAYGGDALWRIDDSNRVELVADRGHYRPGDVATILVPAPFKGMTALVTVERGGVLDHQLIPAGALGDAVQVPIKAEYAPNVFVSVTLIKPGSGPRNVPELRVGMLGLQVETAQQQLDVAITADPPDAAPGDAVTFTLRATDYQGMGARAELSLALVDKAVLSLLDDPNPSLMQSFYERRPLRVFSAQSLTLLVDRVTQRLLPGIKGGGGGLSADVLLRRNFPDTAYWNPSVVTGEDGLAQVTVRLPDNLTTWRLQARAISADTRVGQAELDLKVTRPLLIRPATPRFVTVGDRFSLQAVVHNNSAAPVAAVARLDSGDLTLLGAVEQEVRIPAGEQTLVTWPVSVGQELARAGGSRQATLRLSVTGDWSATAGAALADAVELTLPVQRYATAEVLSAGGLRDGEERALELPAPAPPGEAGAPGADAVELTMTPSIAAGIADGLNYLTTYPYGCTEQTTSSFLPNSVILWLLEQLERLHLEIPGLESGLETNMAIGVQRLYTLQQLDGGWGWWEQDTSNPFVSAYAMHGLLAARRAGYPVDAEVLRRGTAYLRQTLSDSASTSNFAIHNSQFSRGSARAYMLFVLAEAGQPDRGRTVALFEAREGLSVEGKAYLLLALSGLRGEEQRRSDLVRELSGAVSVDTAEVSWRQQDSDGWMMGSDTRTTALVLWALVRADPDNLLVRPAVRHLLQARDGEHWRTTQESSLALIALAEYLRASHELDADFHFQADLNGQTLREVRVGPDNLTEATRLVIDLAGQEAAGPGGVLTLRRAGSGEPTYTLRAFRYLEPARVRAAGQGFTLRRDYLVVDPATLRPTGASAGELKVGEVIQVRLTLTVPRERVYVALEDMLPAGLEALDTSLKTASALARGPELRPDDGEYPYWWYFGHAEIHDNRVALFAEYLPPGTYHYTYMARATTPGLFQTLPASVGEMYRPEIAARSDGRELRIAAP